MESTKSLVQKVAHGGLWIAALKITGQLLNLLQLVVIARILSPHDIGLMGIALLTMATLDTFSETGFEEAIIQKKEQTEQHLNSAWTVLVLRGFILFALLYFIAPYAGAFFRVSSATLIIRAIGFSFLFQGFGNVAVFYLRKELEFNKQFIYQLSGIIANCVISVVAVLILKSVWALVIGLLAGNLVSLLVSYLIHPYRPRFTRDLSQAKELFNFGKWVFALTILIFLFTQGDDAFVGRLLGASMLGFYQLAYRISSVPNNSVTALISQVIFPAYSKLQDNLSKLRDAFLKTLQFTAFLSVPLMGGIIILASEFTRIFLGEKWMYMVLAMQILAIWSFIRSITGASSSLLYGAGRPDVEVKLTTIKVVILASLIYPLTRMWGIFGTSVAVVGSSLIVDPWLSYVVIKKTIHCSWWSFGKQIVFPIIATSIMILGIALLRPLLGSINIIKFLALTLSGMVLYLISILIIDKVFNYNLVATIMQISGADRSIQINKDQVYNYLPPRDNIK